MGSMPAPWSKKWHDDVASGVNPLNGSAVQGWKPKVSPSGALHVIIDGAPAGTTMPTSPATPAPHTSMPMPGHAAVAP
jgi:hypothetical protein